ncbi:MAG: CPBP family intramembrane glutamic endopeptidase [Phycisphaerales bacterium]
MFHGLAGTRFGPAMPIIVTALVWALMHQQYGWVEIVTIFFFGLLLGYVRHRTSSITPTILMHITVNFVSCALFMISHT